MDQHRDRGAARRWTLALAGALAVAGLASGGIVDGARADTRPLLTQILSGPTTTVKPKPRPKTEVPATTKVASLVGDIPTYDAPNGHRIGTAGHWYGYALSAPVIGWADGGWVKIRLPQRPNGSTAWIQSKYARFSNDPYRIVIHTDSTKLILYKDGNRVAVAPVGLGVPKTPTPKGSYFVTVVEHDHTAGYGPFQLDTSAHSEAIQSWQGSGDAITAIHGPISPKSDKQIGTQGTYISNGCVRMHLSDLQQLASVPIGTPVDIVP